ncbi:DUF4262 domain-containing protein [Nevskia soli]|uniref:DUF4262 domain-containing protein n=1 Tax=Nevskia soli TaxID=418856 RepID=UPI00068CE055|nr:DUF4262 domain-containing protein [Nevskia soli]
MLSNFVWRTPDDSSDRKLLADVKEYGWHIVEVFDNVPSDRPRPSFCFSVGLFLNHEHPEIVLMGLPGMAVGRIINQVGAFIRDGGRIIPEKRYNDFIPGREVIFRPIDDSQYGEYLGTALWFYRSLLPKSFPALQLVWPDKSGVFPWEDGFAQEYSSLQHALWNKASSTSAEWD